LPRTLTTPTNAQTISTPTPPHTTMPGLKLVRTDTPLLMYRHMTGQSQSSKTPRKLLLRLRLRVRMLVFRQMLVREDVLMI
jgi:hypothetical protein